MKTKRSSPRSKKKSRSPRRPGPAPLALFADVVVAVDMEDGAGRVGDDLQVGAEGLDDGRDGPVPQVDDERRRRVEGRDLAEETFEGLVVIGDRVPDDGEPQLPAAVAGLDGPDGFRVGGDQPLQRLGDFGEPGVLAEPGQVKAAFLDAVTATAREQGQDKRHQQGSLSQHWFLSSLRYPL